MELEAKQPVGESNNESEAQYEQSSFEKAINFLLCRLHYDLYFIGTNAIVLFRPHYLLPKKIYRLYCTPFKVFT